MPAKQSQTAETPIETQVSNQQQPLAIGRIVHFVTADGSERAAMVTRVYGSDKSGVVDLAVFTTAEEHGKQGAVYGYGSASYDAGGTQPNTWHWPAEGTPHPEVSTTLGATADTADTSSATAAGAAGAQW